MERILCLFEMRKTWPSLPFPSQQQPHLVAIYKIKMQLGNIKIIFPCHLIDLRFFFFLCEGVGEGLQRTNYLLLGFPGGAVVRNLPANAGDRGSSPGLGRSHMPRSN